MDVFFLCFRLGPALKFIFRINYIPQKEDFKELTPAQYQAMRVKVPEEELRGLVEQKVFTFLPDDPRVYNRVYNLYGDDLLIMGEDELCAFEAAEEMIEKYCKDSGDEFSGLPDKLAYMARCLPEVFSKDTPYAIHASCRNMWNK